MQTTTFQNNKNIALNIQNTINIISNHMNLKSITTFFFVFLIGIISSKAQYVKLPESLKENSEILPVKGRNGIQINQVITFGDFKTSKIKKGWTKTSKFTSSATSVSSSSQKFSFVQNGPNNIAADVACLGELSKIDIEIIKNLFSIGTDFKSCFTGSITISETEIWDFIIIDPEKKPDNGSSSGFIRKENSELIELFASTELEGKKIPKFLQGVVQGYEFRMADEPIGIVSLYNKGDVILKNGLPDNIKLVIASLSTALLVKADLNDQ